MKKLFVFLVVIFLIGSLAYADNGIAIKLNKLEDVESIEGYLDHVAQSPARFEVKGKTLTYKDVFDKHNPEFLNIYAVNQSILDIDIHSKETVDFYLNDYFNLYMTNSNEKLEPRFTIMVTEDSKNDDKGYSFGFSEEKYYEITENLLDNKYIDELIKKEEIRNYSDIKLYRVKEPYALMLLIEKGEGKFAIPVHLSPVTPSLELEELYRLEDFLEIAKSDLAEHNNSKDPNAIGGNSFNKSINWTVLIIVLSGVFTLFGGLVSYKKFKFSK